jgi:dihydroxy-acid dehydratase
VQILYGNLAPEGSVAKITGKEGLQFRGPARVFDSEEDMLAVVAEDPQQLKVRRSIRWCSRRRNEV